MNRIGETRDILELLPVLKIHYVMYSFEVVTMTKVILAAFLRGRDRESLETRKRSNKGEKTLYAQKLL